MCGTSKMIDINWLVADNLADGEEIGCGRWWS